MVNHVKSGGHWHMFRSDMQLETWYQLLIVEVGDVMYPTRKEDVRIFDDAPGLQSPLRRGQWRFQLHKCQ